MQQRPCQCGAATDLRHAQLYETLPECKLPDRSSSLARRAIDAQRNMPQNAAHVLQLARVADESVRFQFRSDDVIHGFARSRTACNNPMQQWHAELAVHPQHWPTQRPTHNERLVRDARMAVYDQVSPVAGGFSASKRWSY